MDGTSGSVILTPTEGTMRYDVIDQIAGRAVLTGQGSLACAERIFLAKRRWLDLGASRPEREVGQSIDL